MRTGDTFVGVLKFIWDTALAVILRPVAFFQTMPKVGGFRTPYIFLLVIGLFDLAILSLLQMLVMGPVAGLTFAGRVFILAPLALTISGFALTTILFVFWRLMGSSQSYETAYRAFVYSYAISPVTTVIGFVPYFAFVGFFWWFALLVIASVYVHGIHRAKAIAVFAVLAVALLAFLARVERYALRHGLGQPLLQQAARPIHKGLREGSGPPAGRRT